MIRFVICSHFCQEWLSETQLYNVYMQSIVRALPCLHRARQAQGGGSVPIHCVRATMAEQQHEWSARPGEWFCAVATLQLTLVLVVAICVLHSDGNTSRLEKVLMQTCCFHHLHRTSLANCYEKVLQSTIRVVMASSSGHVFTLLAAFQLDAPRCRRSAIFHNRLSTIEFAKLPSQRSALHTCKVNAACPCMLPYHATYSIKQGLCE